MKRTAAPAFLLLLGVAGGVENGSLGLWPGFLLMALCLAVLGISIARSNRREQKRHEKRLSTSGDQREENRRRAA